MIHDCAQLSPEWFQLRSGRVSGSDADSLVTPAKLKLSASAKPGGALFMRVYAERLTGLPTGDELRNKDLDHGRENEEKALEWLAVHTGKDIHPVGGVSRGENLWASPDGAVRTAGVKWTEGVETKCPAKVTNHLRYLRDPSLLRRDHGMQCQFGLYVTGWDIWTLMSWCGAKDTRGRPIDNVVETIEVDLEIHLKFDEALEALEAGIAAELGAYEARQDARYAALDDLSKSTSHVWPEAVPGVSGSGD